jgi:hypothetical protein
MNCARFDPVPVKLAANTRSESAAEGCASEVTDALDKEDAEEEASEERDDEVGADVEEEADAALARARPAPSSVKSFEDEVVRLVNVE